MAPTDDTRQIERVYSAGLKQRRPEDDPKAFQEWHAAYQAAHQAALHFAQHLSRPAQLAGASETGSPSWAPWAPDQPSSSSPDNSSPSNSSPTASNQGALMGSLLRPIQGPLPGDQLANQPGDQPVVQLYNQPLDQPVDQPVDQLGDQPADQLDNQPGDQRDNEPVDQVDNERDNEPADQRDNELANEPGDQLANEPGSWRAELDRLCSEIPAALDRDAVDEVHALFAGIPSWPLPLLEALAPRLEAYVLAHDLPSAALLALASEIGWNNPSTPLSQELAERLDAKVALRDAMLRLNDLAMQRPGRHASLERRAAQALLDPAKLEPPKPDAMLVRAQAVQLAHQLHREFSLQADQLLKPQAFAFWRRWANANTLEPLRWRVATQASLLPGALFLLSSSVLLSIAGHSILTTALFVLAAWLWQIVLVTLFRAHPTQSADITLGERKLLSEPWIAPVLAIVVMLPMLLAQRLGLWPALLSGLWLAYISWRQTHDPLLRSMTIAIAVAFVVFLVVYLELPQAVRSYFAIASAKGHSFHVWGTLGLVAAGIYGLLKADHLLPRSPTDLSMESLIAFLAGLLYVLSLVSTHMERLQKIRSSGPMIMALQVDPRQPHGSWSNASWRARNGREAP